MCSISCAPRNRRRAIGCLPALWLVLALAVVVLPAPATAAASPAYPERVADASAAATEMIGGLPYDASKDRGTDHGPNGHFETNKARVYRWANDCRNADDYYCQTMDEARADSVARLYSEFLMDSRDDWDRHSGFTGIPPGWANSHHNNPAKSGTGDGAFGANNPTTGSGGTNSGSGLPFGFPDPGQLFKQAFETIFHLFLTTIADLLRSLRDGLLGLLNMNDRPIALTIRPDITYQAQPVRFLYDQSLKVALAAVAVILLIGGYGVMASQTAGREYADTLGLLKRVGGCALMAALSFTFCQLLIDLVDQIAFVVTGPGLPGFTTAPADSQLNADLLIMIFYFATTCFLLIELLMRHALVDLLIAVAPLAVIGYALPQTEWLGRLWTRTLCGAVIAGFIQSVVLKLAALFITDGILGPPGGEGFGTSYLKLGLLGCFFILAQRAPGLIGKFADHGNPARLLLFASRSFVAGVAGATGVNVAAGGRGALARAADGATTGQGQAARELRNARDDRALQAPADDADNARFATDWPARAEQGGASEYRAPTQTPPGAAGHREPVPAGSANRGADEQTAGPSPGTLRNFDRHTALARAFADERGNQATGTVGHQRAKEGLARQEALRRHHWRAAGMPGDPPPLGPDPSRD